MGSQLNQWLPIFSAAGTNSVKGGFSADQEGMVSSSAWILCVCKWGFARLCGLVPGKPWTGDSPWTWGLGTPELNDILSVVKFCTSLLPPSHYRNNFIFITHPLLTSFFQQSKVISVAFRGEYESMVTIHRAKGV